MTLNKIMAKLRRQNKGQYRILGLCIFLSVLLVASFALMYFSPTMQKLLPEGGDTRKLSLLLFGVIITGCTIFTVYGANLFYKYKSREFGIFLALGEQKSTLSKCLGAELSAVISRYTLVGLVSAVPVSFLVWKIYQALVVSARGLPYSFGIIGLLAGALFACFLTLCILGAGIRFIRRANVIDILNEERKTELVKEIGPSTGRRGIILIIIGFILAMGVPPVFTNLFMRLLPSVWNLTYLISVAGLYMVMLSAVGHKKRGKHPEKYYKNIISTNLMRFTARQTTRNMCVITMLIFVFLISSFWGVMYYHSMSDSGNNALYDCFMHFPQTENQVGKADIDQIAEKHKITITSYEESNALELVIRYVGRDLNDEGEYFDITREKLASFLSASDFARISGEQIDLTPGEYMTVVHTGYKRKIWEGPDSLVEIIHPVTKEKLEPIFKGTTEFDNLTDISEPFTFILSDEDYNHFDTAMEASGKEHMIFFSVNDVEKSYPFAEELEKEYIARASEDMAYSHYYDAHSEALARSKGEDYTEGWRIDLSSDNKELISDWKYAPFFRVMVKADTMELVAVFLLLAAYVAIISFTAVGVMTYVRSITIAIDNKQLFTDLRKLGANKAYERRVIKNQLGKIFSYPVMAASLVSLLFALFLTFFNDMRLAAFEIRMVAMTVLMIMLIGLFMYGMYRVSFQKMEKIVRQ